MIDLERDIFNNEDIEKIKNEKEIIELVKEGDEGAWKDLINKYKNLFFKLANKYSYFDKEDLYSEYIISLYEAVKKFKEDKKVSFKTFLYYLLKRRIYILIRNSKRQKRKVEYVELKENINLYYEDKNIVEIELKEAIEKVKEKLSNLELKVLELYINNYTINEIAKELNLNLKVIDNALKRVKVKCRNL